jgi:hypothetical protein
MVRAFGVLVPVTCTLVVSRQFSTAWRRRFAILTPRTTGRAQHDMATT